MIRISVCMIVKDEAETLPRCLGSLSGIADEIIIADTGSRDNTKQAAAAYTDKIFDFPWGGDFAAARNFAFSKASMDFIYSADADETIDAENRGRFLKLKETLAPDVDVVQMKYANQLRYNTTYNFDTEYRPKLFRRLRPFRWTGPVHETVELAAKVWNSDITVLHMPTGPHAGRDLALLLAASKSGPLDSRLHRMYAKELFIGGTGEDFSAAFPYFESVLHDGARSVGDVRAAECVVVREARRRGNERLMMKTALKNVIADPCAEVCCELGHFFRGAGDWEEAATWYCTAAFGAHSELDIRSSGKIPLLCLARCYDELGCRGEAEKYRSQAAAWAPPAPDGNGEK